MEIEKIDGEIGEVTLRGKVLTCENRELRSGKFILTFDVSDFTDTITVKMFIRPEIFDEVKSAINPGMFIKVKGVTTIGRRPGAGGRALGCTYGPGCFRGCGRRERAWR